MSLIRLHRGETLFRQGESGDLYKVRDGLLKIVRVNEDGGLFMFNLIMPGELIPHRSLLSPHPYYGTAIAVTDDCIVERIDAQSWYARLERDPIHFKEIALIMQEKLVMVQQRIDQLTITSARKRMERFTKWFSDQFPQVPLQSLLTQEEISQFIGLRRETVNRILKAETNQFLL